MKGTVEMSQPAPRVWILLGGRLGDNNQLLALAGGLGLPFEAKTLSYNWLRHLPLLHRFGLSIVSRRSRDQIRPPWPDAVMSIAYSGVAVARFIKEQSGGETRLIHIGNPRTATDDLDLVIITPQFLLKQAPNVLALPFPIGNPARMTTVNSEEKEWLEDYPRPRRLIAVGGATRKWKISGSELERAVKRLQLRRATEGGSIIAVTSPRTTPRTKDALRTLLSGRDEVAVENFPRFAVLLAECDQFYVTADSVSMLAEAIVTGKPVGMIPIAQSFRGRISHWLGRHVRKVPAHADLRRFWDFLIERRLVGTVDEPVASDCTDTVATAVNAVRELLERG
jgi:mitochondrial fission protein ELM1